ncbi:hypothetical protein TURU_133750 [Turdus rufiventris]|nr:hypothetical protein TURU_133750 [Turdus rufiventris]
MWQTQQNCACAIPPCCKESCPCHQVGAWRHQKGLGSLHESKRKLIFMGYDGDIGDTEIKLIPAAIHSGWTQELVRSSDSGMDHRDDPALGKAVMGGRSQHLLQDTTKSCLEGADFGGNSCRAPGETMSAQKGKIQLQRILGLLELAHQGMDMAPRLPELTEFGQCSQGQGGIAGDGAVQGQELDWMVLVGSFQLSRF